ncbi:PAS domain-containing sensor histidine kinase [Rhodospira trueperi]|uniref:histidine kinase n=1 Tax=Rhodospira trueperi TaxID=69960 RepID=A0A1G7CSK9_9PROT|nr:PAS domain-containing sensor histidine kinase [Rhodospira trueperi]SDE42404.1 Histidine kinase-, DNA gyrase B-, and HSP90-like ATPase [Rhodospira trueperi]
MAFVNETHFAPPERLDRETLKTQARKVAGAEYPAAILDGVSIPVFVLNANRQIVFANSAFRQFVPNGETLDFIGQRAGEAVACIHADEDEAPGGCGTAPACRDCEAIASVLRAQAKGRDERTFQLALHGGDAVNAMIRATRIEVDSESFVIVALVDIKDTLWHRDIERAFLHDVMNIAGSIRSSSEAIAHFDPETQKAYMERIVVACDTLITEIHSHRLMIHAEDGALEPAYETLDSHAFLTDMAVIIGQHTVSRDRRIEVAPDARGVPFQSDRGLLSRVLINLLKNALEASDPGGTVTANTGYTDDAVWFSIHNETAMPNDVASKIFRRFFSTKGASRGIGTYAAKLLTEKYLGGKIGFSTAVDTGTTFTVTYPRSGR